MMPVGNDSAQWLKLSSFILPFAEYETSLNGLAEAIPGFVFPKRLRDQNSFREIR